MGRESYTLDIRLEVDDFDLEDLAHRISFAENEQRYTISRIVMREVQYRAMMRMAGERYGVEREVTQVYGHDVVLLEDGLTPRERSVRRALEDFPPTRQDQVAALLAGTPVPSSRVHPGA